MTDRPPTLFQTARDELRAIGIDLSIVPGCWCVNYRGATAATAYYSDDLPDAIEYGREMAKSILGKFVARGQAAQAAADKVSADYDKSADMRRALEAVAKMEGATAATGKPPRAKWRRRRMTPKAQRRRLIKAHNRKLRSPPIKQRDDT